MVEEEVVAVAGDREVAAEFGAMWLGLLLQLEANPDATFANCAGARAGWPRAGKSAEKSASA